MLPRKLSRAASFFTEMRVEDELRQAPGRSLAVAAVTTTDWLTQHYWQQRVFREADDDPLPGVGARRQHVAVLVGHQQVRGLLVSGAGVQRRVVLALAVVHAVASTTSKRPLGTSSSGSTSSSASSVSALGSSGSARGSVGRCTRRGVGRRVGCRDTVHANAIAKEKFSSPIKHFLVLCSVNYPTDTWLVLGKFTAAHANGEQTFQLDTQQHVRYIKFRFLSHYGSDCHCTLSQLRCLAESGFQASPASKDSDSDSFFELAATAATIVATSEDRAESIGAEQSRETPVVPSTKTQKSKADESTTTGIRTAGAGAAV
ncbi:hypothetical protein PR001_g15920 [Phytophthora rubi]|uniref:SUN domain-containing protein n=2 Tax=Phytophthora rubi TaxID=129364 RepID=A0A6A3KNX0_9STRA|nr:hypothetical protein PR002_g15845 [Phytophthora rubi]KAE9011424.1 hypothetical protein PR001_g15920 [Phytophthora rubi]